MPELLDTEPGLLLWGCLPQEGGPRVLGKGEKIVRDSGDSCGTPNILPAGQLLWLHV